MADFVMPSLGADMEQGTIIKWLVKPGDEVHRGDIVVEVETEKADMEVEIFQDGVINEIVVPEGETVPVGALLARLKPVGVAVPAQAPSAERPLPKPEAASVPSDTREPEAPLAPVPVPEVMPEEHHRVTPTARVLADRLGLDLATIEGTGVDGAITRADVEHAAALKAKPPPPSSEERARISPFARRKAAELDVNLDQVTGTGPGGAITAEDVERHAGEAERPVEPAPVEGKATSPVPPSPADEKQRARTVARQRVIANLMERSKREIPHYYLGLTIDLSRSLQWLQEQNLKRPVTERILYSALLLKATALGVATVPEVNGHYEDGEFHPSTTVNIGVAVSLRDGGLVTPALQDTANKTLTELMGDLRDIVQRARSARLRATEMTNATITITNLGDQGVESVQGIIYPPQVAIVGFGKVVERPWAERGMLGVRPTIIATLAADHRVSNGHRGGLFLSAIERLLQEPEKL
jgi:pyruvate dehydrogenase E2 component (dihydrolipoamide acetyltransferase)